MRTNATLGQALLLSLIALCAVSQSRAQSCEPSDRPIVVISDLHFGPGLDSEATKPFDDFRWTQDLKDFLTAVRNWGGDRVDLVIAGDLLELWQHPTVACRAEGESADLGCSTTKVTEVVNGVLRAHSEDLRALGDFAQGGDNRLFIVPGNHDAALLLNDVWQLLASSLRASPRRALRVASGRWISRDCLVAAEHGHQIGEDVNRFDRWPEVTRLSGGEERLIRTWGENLVDSLFNDVELGSPLIDNLQPLSLSVKYRWKSQGISGRASDVGRFLLFNLFQTSLAQKIALAPESADPTGGPKWDVGLARSRGHRLVADAMASEDPLRSLLLAGEGEWQSVRAELDSHLADPLEVPEDEILSLCDRVAVLAKTEADSQRVPCTEVLGKSLLHGLVPQDRVLGRHIKMIRREYPQLQLFVYGHTHEMRTPWKVRVPGSSVAVANTGAFQRLLGEEGLHAEAKARGIEPVKVFAELPLENLPACYPAVFVAYKDGLPVAEVKNWYRDQKTGMGELIGPCDLRCGYRNSRSCSGS